MEYIFIADLHIGRTGQSITLENWVAPWGKGYKLVSTRMVEVMSRLAYVTDRAEALEIETVIVGGDIFDTARPKNQDEALFLHWIQYCHQRGVRVVVFPGNHDYGLDWTSLVSIEAANWDNLIVVHGITQITEGDSLGPLVVPHFSSLQWRRLYGEKSLEQVIQERPPVDSIVTHAHVRELEYSSEVFFEASEAMILNLGDLESMGYKGRVYSGHIHSHRIVKAPGGAYLAYPGSVAVNKFDEVDDEKGLLVVGNEGEFWEPYPDDLYPYMQLDVDLVSKDTIEWNKSLLSEFEGVLLKVVVTTDDPLKVDRNEMVRLLNQYGSVVKFEIEVQRSGRDRIEQLEDEESVVTNVNHEDLLEQWLNNTDMDKAAKKRALDIGKEIIGEVMGE